MGRNPGSRPRPALLAARYFCSGAIEQSRDARAESNLLSSQAEYITAQFENLVQSSRTAGTELAEKLQKRVASLV